jgi:hypothetical protein
LKPVLERLRKISSASTRTALNDFAASHGIPIGGRSG